MFSSTRFFPIPSHLPGTVFDLLFRDLVYIAGTSPPSPLITECEWGMFPFRVVRRVGALRRSDVAKESTQFLEVLSVLAWWLEGDPNSDLTPGYIRIGLEPLRVSSPPK